MDPLTPFNAEPATGTLPVLPETPPVQPETPFTPLSTVRPVVVNHKTTVIIFTVILVAVLLLIGLVVYNTYGPGKNSGGATPTVTLTNTPATTITATASVEKTTLKFYVQDTKKDPKVTNCDAPSYVVRNLPTSSSTLTDALNYLMHTLQLSPEEKAEGFKNTFEDPLYLSRLTKLSLTSASVANQVATITLSDPDKFTSAGSCRGSIIKSQFTGTAKQFSTQSSPVSNVKFLPADTLFQP